MSKKRKTIEFGGKPNLASAEAIRSELEVLRGHAVELADNDALNGEALEEVTAQIAVLQTATEQLANRTKVVEEAAAKIGEAPQIARREVPRIPMPLLQVDPEYAGVVKSVAYWNLMTVPADGMAFGSSFGRFEKAHAFRSRRQVLTDDGVALVNEGKFLNDALLIAHLYFSQHGGQAYVQRGGMRGLPLWKPWVEWQKVAKAAAVAMDTLETDAGDQWTPTVPSSLMFETVREKLQLLQYIDRVQMPNNPWRPMVLGRTLVGYRMPENVATTGQTVVDPQNFITLDMLFTAVGQMGAVVASRELTEDSLIAFAEQVVTELAACLAETAEYSAIDGQVSTTIDTPAPSGLDARTCFDGIRQIQEWDPTGIDFAPGMTPDALAACMARLRHYWDPAQCVWATSNPVFAKMLVTRGPDGSYIVLTRDRSGAPTIESGFLGSIFGSPIANSGKYPSDLTADGYRDGTGTMGGLSLFNRRMLKQGWRTNPTIDYSSDALFFQNQLCWKGWQRWHLKSVVTPTATDPWIIKGKGIVLF